MRFHLWASICIWACLIEIQQVHSDDVDGQWSQWSTYTTGCSLPCSGGIRKRGRSCSNPEPSGNGAQCVGESVKEEPCNEHLCAPTGIEIWTNWKLCNDCTIDVKSRYLICDNETQTICTGNQAKTQTEVCNRWNKTRCGDQCTEEKDRKCPEYSQCKDNSTEERPHTICTCVMGFIMNEETNKCLVPPPALPTPRPTPTLPPAEKKVASVLSKSASIVLIAFVSLTLILFIVLRIFTPDRIIQMNMEIALLMAHCFLMFPADITEYPNLCKSISIGIHFAFTACYIFIMLEALHMYSFVAHIVKKGGFFSWPQNVVIGWGLSAFIVLMCICFEFEHYGGSYHCWLQMDTMLLYGQTIPVAIFAVLTFTFIEAAGAADYVPLPGISEEELLSAKISQRTNLIILPLVLAHWIVGMFSEYEQNLPLYGIFSMLNGVLGGSVFFLHCTNNAKMRATLIGAFKKCVKK